MSTTPPQWPDDPLERLEAKLDAYRDEHHLTIHGDASDPTKPGIDGRLRGVERDLAMAKRGGIAAATLGIPMLFDWFKRKVGG
jgi:hypothetical protein